MLETIKNWIGQNGFMISVVSCMVAVNYLLTGIYNFLGWLKDKTATQADDKAWAFIAKLIGWVQKVIEIGQGNQQHK